MLRPFLQPLQDDKDCDEIFMLSTDLEKVQFGVFFFPSLFFFTVSPGSSK